VGSLVVSGREGEDFNKNKELPALPKAGLDVNVERDLPALAKTEVDVDREK